MRANDGLVFIRIVKSLWIAQIRDVHCRNVVAKSQCKVGQFAILGNVGVDGNTVLCLVSQINKQFCYALIAIGILALRIYHPDLAEGHGTKCCQLLFGSGKPSMDLRGKSSTLWVTWDEFDILNTATLINC